MLSVPSMVYKHLFLSVLSFDLSLTFFMFDFNIFVFKYATSGLTQNNIHHRILM